MQYARAISCLVLFALVAAPGEADAQRRRRNQAATGQLVVQCSVEGARVVVDEFEIGTTPVEPIELEPGPHTIHISRPGYTEFTDVVRMEAGEHRELPVELFALSMVLRVSTEPPAARVFVDGDFRGEAPLELELTEGEHSLRIALSRYHEVIRSVTASPGATDELALTLEPLSAAELGNRPAEWYEEPLTWIAIGGGALVLAITIAVIAAVTSSGPSQVDTFCMQASMGDCLQRAVPSWMQ